MTQQTMQPDVYTAAAQGDREAQLAVMVETLARHMRMLLVFVSRVNTDELRQSTLELAEAALECLKAADMKSTEPMNLRLHQDGTTWFIRGFGYSGSGLTPGLALRDLARHLNSSEKEQWLVEGEPLLQCIDCRNTESPAGAMARQFNHGRCVHCGGYFKVVRA